METLFVLERRDLAIMGVLHFFHSAFKGGVSIFTEPEKPEWLATICREALHLMHLSRAISLQFAGVFNSNIKHNLTFF